MSKVKSCSGSDLWGPDEIARMQELNLVFPNKQKYCESGGLSGPGTETEKAKADLMDLCMAKYGLKALTISKNSSDASVHLKCKSLAANRIRSVKENMPCATGNQSLSNGRSQVESQPDLSAVGTQSVQDQRVHKDKFDFDEFFGLVDVDGDVHHRSNVKANQSKLAMVNEHCVNSSIPADLKCCASGNAPASSALKRQSTDELWEGFEDW
jgi:hypothetical protein